MIIKSVVVLLQVGLSQYQLCSIIVIHNNTLYFDFPDEKEVILEQLKLVQKTDINTTSHRGETITDQDVACQTTQTQCE